MEKKPEVTMVTRHVHFPFSPMYWCFFYIAAVILHAPVFPQVLHSNRDFALLLMLL